MNKLNIWEVTVLCDTLWCFQATLHVSYPVLSICGRCTLLSATYNNKFSPYVLLEILVLKLLMNSPF